MAKETINLAKQIFVLWVMVSFLSGCGFWGRLFESEEMEADPAELMSEGMENFENGYYQAASEAFQRLKDRYPYSRYAIEAELRLADALYKTERYEEALEAYSEFERMHPKNPDIPHVIYQMGMCHFDQVKTYDRDQTNTFQAKEEFERLMRRYPESDYAKKAENKIRECYIYLAEYELYVGHFYYKQKKYRAALNRYRYLLENYPDLGQYHEAIEYFALCKEKLPKEEQKELEKKHKAKSWWYRLTHPF